MNNARLADIAKKVGVTVATVSRNLNHKTSKRNSKYEAILRAAEEIGYKVDTANVPVKLQNVICVTIGVHTPNDGSVDSNMGYTPAGFWGRFILGVEKGVQKYQAKVILYNFDASADTGNAIARMAKQDNADGIILMTNGDCPSLKIPNASCPVIFLNASQRLEFENVDAVVADDVFGVQMAVKKLNELGHKKIAFWNVFPTDSHHLCRCEGYRNQMQAMGLNYERVYYEKKDKYPDLPFMGRMEKSFEEEYLQDVDRPTAIIAGNDLFANTLIRLATQHGICIPKDLSLFGFDNIELCAHTCPSLSSISLDMEAMGYEAVRLLARRIEEPLSCCCRVVLPAKLVERESISFPSK